MIKSILDPRNSCFKVVPHKVSIYNRARLDKHFSKEDLF